MFFTSGMFEGYGRTDDQGRYTLVRGAPVGDCRVYITKPRPNEQDHEIDLGFEGMDEEQIRSMRLAD